MDLHSFDPQDLMKPSSVFRKGRKMNTLHPRVLPYDPFQLPRELTPFYISADEDDIKNMLKAIGLSDLDELYKHIPRSLWFDEFKLGPSLSYEDLCQHIIELSQKNHPRTCFIGDGLKNYKVPEIVSHVAQIRGLLTAYTPYQPERSQGTLTSLWLYSSLLSMITGYEAINASLYDRSTCLFEALQCAQRIQKKGQKVIVLESLYPGDLEVVNTHAVGTEMEVTKIPTRPETGRTDLKDVRLKMKELKGDLVALAFPQVNSLGCLEDVDGLTDLCYEFGIQSIAVVDPMLLSTGGLKPPSHFGKQLQGAHIIVGEGQHLAIGPHYGGPGLGIFGIRYQDNKNSATLRGTPGRFVGKARDIKGRECKSLILSTREQHIRREKATSNICSNQSFVATLVGAAILNRGEEGMTKACLKGRDQAFQMAEELTRYKGVQLAFSATPFFNEFVLQLPVDVDSFIEKARQADLHIGVNVSKRTANKNNRHLLLSFFDLHEEKDLQKLVNFFRKEFGEPTEKGVKPASIPKEFLRQGSVNLPSFSTAELKDYYEKLGEQNLNPDHQMYPLGSCTMKYNPYLHEFAAGLNGWQHLHPQAPLADAQGSLELLYEIQEMFKQITGLSAVTTQPCAGAQGELVGLKLFQAYHASKGEEKQRQIVLIPQTAHGTNPASATMAGLITREENGVAYGIVEIQANSIGMMDFDHLQHLVKTYGTRIFGVMVTNPNTSGIFETQFKEMADLIHSVGGLVYMDGANMNAIAGQVNLNKMGVDAVHNNLHKTWTIPHGGGGPGDAIVAVSEKLIPFLPGGQVIKDGNGFHLEKPKYSIGSIHRHFGNFAHKVRCYTYLKYLGTKGVKQMSSVAVLSARYLYHKLSQIYPTLPEKAQQEPRLHEFIITLSPKTFQRIEQIGIPRAQIITKIGKLFLDFGIHTPTVAFPETLGLMIEPTESYTKQELDRFVDVVKAIHLLIHETPEILHSVPHFTPVDRIDEVAANKVPVLWERITSLPEIYPNRLSPEVLSKMNVGEICKEILQAHKNSV